MKSEYLYDVGDSLVHILQIKGSLTDCQHESSHVSEFAEGTTYNIATPHQTVQLRPRSEAQDVCQLLLVLPLG